MLISSIKELCCDKYIGSKRALCIDYGNKRIGLAISDIDWLIASPLKVLKSCGVFAELFKIIKENSIGLIVIGMPKALNGGIDGKQLEKVKKFADKLIELSEENSLNIDVLYWDERLSTNAADRILRELDIKRNKYKQNIDKIAASFILQGVLDYVCYKSLKYT
ncbi:MAG: Holliday junction resolvase RuvX [Holosporales bacterium]|jgi:putative Holliday junction resolvase|nr:Holliday junction resolvase RuvX [Holosporales bacterium]